MTELQRFLAARDFLLAHRTDYAAAVAGFQWPSLARFNWALDYFDAIARDNDAPALHIVEESGIESRLSYAQLARRSSQVANFLAAGGARRGDRILLMLGNEVPLWETMLAAIKLGAVLIPATTLLAGRDLADRIERGRVRHVITNGAGRARFDELPASLLAGINLICTDPTRAGRASRARAHRPIAGSTFASRRRLPTRSCPPIPAASTTRCWSTSRRAPPPSPSSCATAARAIRWATCRRCTGWG